MKHLPQLWVLIFLMPVCATAEITVLREYLMGDADPSADVDTAVSASKDSAGDADLASSGSPVYYRAINRPRFGKLGQSQAGVGLEFDGAGSLTATSMPELVDNFGVEAWFLCNGGPLTLRNGTAGQGWSLECIDHVIGNLGPPIDGDGLPIHLRSSLTALVQWHHVAMVRDQELTRLYVDGVYISPVAKSGAPLPTSDPFAIQGGSGLIDEVRIFSFLPGHFRQEDLSYPMPSASPLEIAKSGNGTLDLRWPGTRFKRVMETTTDLQSGEWTTLADPTTPTSNAFYQVSVPVAATRRFFRLNRLPPTSAWKGWISYGTTNNLNHIELLAEFDTPAASAKISAFVASRDRGIDASLSVDPATGDSSAIRYQWEIFASSAYAAQLGTGPITLPGISGHQTSSLHLKPNSLPQLATITSDPEATFWRCKLTLRHEPFVADSPFPQQKTYWFRFRYSGSALTIAEVNQQIQEIHGN